MPQRGRTKRDRDGPRLYPLRHENWIYSWYNPKGTIKPDELSQLIYEVFTGGVNNPLLAMKRTVQRTRATAKARGAKKRLEMRIS
jgi:hypothetical protein